MGAPEVTRFPVLAVLLLVAAPAAAEECQSLRLPSRSPDAASGSELALESRGMTGRARQALFVREIEAGNVPEFLRCFVPVEAGEVTFFVLSDYLAVGSDRDFLRVPLTMPSIRALVRRFGLRLPTPRMVDLVHEAAPVKLEPRPLPPGPKMRSSETYLRHQEIIEGQIESAAGRRRLVSGHKKDIVLTRRLRSMTDRIAIYGWHRASGRPIQPLSTVHGSRYADYSHGVRWVFDEVEVEGGRRKLVDVLADPRLAPRLSDVGPIDARGVLDP